MRKVGRAKRNTLPQSELHDLEHHQLGVFSILVSVMEFSERPLRGDLFAFIRADTALMAAIGTKRLPLSGHGFTTLNVRVWGKAVMLIAQRNVCL